MRYVFFVVVFQCPPAIGCSVASCNFDVLAGKDEHMSFYSAIMNQSSPAFLYSPPPYLFKIFICSFIFIGVKLIYNSVCQFLLYSKENQLNIYIYPLFLGFTSHLGHLRTVSRLLMSYLFYTSSINISIPVSLSIPHTPLPH